MNIDTHAYVQSAIPLHDSANVRRLLVESHVQVRTLTDTQQTCLSFAKGAYMVIW